MKLIAKKTLNFKLNRFVYVLIFLSLFTSCKKGSDSLLLNEAKLNEVASKYNLQRATATDVYSLKKINVKKFSTIEEFEAYLIRNNEPRKSKTITAEVKKITNKPALEVPVSNSTVSNRDAPVDESSQQSLLFSATFHLEEFEDHGYPDTYVLGWTASYTAAEIKDVTSSYLVTGWDWSFATWSYNHSSGTATYFGMGANSPISAVGIYTEGYEVLGTFVYTRNYRITCNATWLNYRTIAGNFILTQL